MLKFAWWTLLIVVCQIVALGIKAHAGHHRTANVGVVDWPRSVMNLFRPHECGVSIINRGRSMLANVKVNQVGRSGVSSGFENRGGADFCT